MQSFPGGWQIVDCEPHVAIKLKSIFSAIPKESVPPFNLTGGAQIAADLLWFTQRYPMLTTARDRKRIVKAAKLYQEKQDELKSIFSSDWEPTGDVKFREGYEPYAYQMQAAELCGRTGRLLLMDDVGLGKSVSALAVLTRGNRLPAAIVVQTHLATQWRDDFIHEFTGLKAHVVQRTTPYEIKDVDVVIFKYSNLAGWIDYISTAGFKTVIYDEMQELRRGMETQKGRAARVLSDNAEIKMGLTATPIFNYGEEIWHIAQYLDPEVLGTYDNFTREFCEWNGRHQVVMDPEALGSYLAEQHLTLRRTEHDVGSEMPPVNTILHEVPYDEDVAEEHEQVARSLAMKVVTGSFQERGQASRELDVLARHTTGVAKAKFVAAYVGMLLEAGETVLLTGWHREVYDIWLKELARFNPVLYTGSETAARKRKNAKVFIDGDTNLLIMSLRSGSGLNGLQFRCSTIVHGELDASPMVHKQITGRLRRRGQDDQVTSVYLWTDQGSDPVYMDIHGLKSSQSHGIVDPLRAPAERFTDESRMRRLAQQYLDSKAVAGA